MEENKKERIKPSIGFYALGAAVLIAGGIFFLIFVINAARGMTNSGKRILVPGENEITLEEEGRYVIYHEYNSVFDGKTYTSTDISGLRITLKNKNNGEEIEIKEALFNESYSIGSREGSSVFEFFIEKPETIILYAYYDDKDKESEAVINISKNLVGNMLKTIGLAILELLASMTIGIGIIAITAIKRNRNKHQVNGV